MPELPADALSPSRRGSEEPLDFQPSEHAIDLLKEFVAAPANSRGSITSAYPPSSFLINAQTTATSAAAASRSSSSSSSSSVVAVPATTSLPLLDRMHSLSSQLSRFLSSPPARRSPPLDHEEIHRVLLAAEGENTKRAIPSFHAFAEQVQAMTAVEAVRQLEEQAVRMVGGDDEEVMGRRYRLEAAVGRRAAGKEREEVKDAGEPETVRVKREEQRQRDTLSSAILKLEAAIADGQRCGLSPQQWSMLSAQSALSHLIARRDFFSNRDVFTAAAAAPQPFLRDRLLTAAAHLNAHHLVADGRLPALEVAGCHAEGAPATVIMNIVSESPLMTTSRSPAASPLLSSHQPLHRAFHGLSPAFSPVQITAETTLLSSASHSHSAALPVPTAFSLDSVPVTRSPSQSISNDKAHLSDIRTRSASPSVSSSAPPPATPSASSAVVRMGGFLRKKSPASFILSSWQTRYFRLSSSALSYYQDAAPTSACLGAVPLSGIREVRERGPVSKRAAKGEQPAWRFDVLVDGDRTFELEAAAEEEGRVWLSKIREQVEAWHEKSKLAMHHSDKPHAGTTAAAGASRAARDAAPKAKDKKWWKDRTFVNKLKTKEGGAASAAAKAQQGATRTRQNSRSGHAALSIGQRVGRGELEALREDATLAASAGRAIVVRDRTRPLPAAFRPSFPVMTPPSSSPSFTSMTPPGCSSSFQPLPYSAVVRRNDGLYLLHLLPPSTPPAIISALFDSMSCLSHPSLLRPVLRGESSDSTFTLYSPGLPSASSSSLAAHLARLRRFDVDSVRHVALHLILTLGFLHCEERGCGRLSAETAHMGEEGEIIVADLLLGLSCRQRVQLVRGRTGDEEERVEGRVEYMSPEQLRLYERLHRPGQGKDGDEDEEEQAAMRMTDWWRLGALLYELSTGTLPFCLKLPNYATTASLPTSSSPALISSSSAPAARAAARARLLQVLQANAANASFLRFPASTPRQLQSLISSLLTVDAEARLGSGNDWRDVLAHPFFDGCGLDVTQIDLLDRLTCRLPPFLLQHVLEPAGATPAGTERGTPAATAAAPATPYYSYRYRLSLTAHRAANVRLPYFAAARPGTPSQSSAAARPVPALYVHLCIDGSTQVTSTISGTESPQWSQAFDFALPAVSSSRGEAASDEATGEERATEDGMIGEKVDLIGGDGAGGEWEGCTVRVEVRHQLRTSSIAHSDQPLYECVGLAECSVAQLLQLHRHALASASALDAFTRPASQSVSVPYSTSGVMAAAPPAPSSSFCLSLLGADGLPNGELYVDMAVMEERSVARDRADEERWQGRHISVSDVFGGLPEEAKRGWERERRGGRQLAGREEERFVESAAPIATPAAAILLHGKLHTASKSALRLRQPPQRLQQQKVAQQCQRYQQDTFDLDLCCITSRILCCALPDTGGKDVRHSSAEMERFLRAKHAGQCRVVRLLRSAAAEDAKALELDDCAAGSRVWHVDGDVVALWQLLAWCAEVEDWLSGGERHALLLQCEDGLQLSCAFICAALLFDGFVDSVDTAVKLCHARRCLPDTDVAAVVSSSQHRQLGYLQQMLADDSGEIARVPSRPLHLLHVRLSPPVGEQLSIRVRTVGPASYLLYDSSSSPAPEAPSVPHSGTATGWDVDGVVCSGDCLLSVLDGDGGCVLEVYWHSSFVINHHLAVRAGQAAAQMCELFFSAVE